MAGPTYVDFASASPAPIIVDNGDGTGTQFIAGSGAGCSECVALYHVAGSPYWTPFFFSDCSDSGEGQNEDGTPVDCAEWANCLATQGGCDADFSDFTNCAQDPQTCLEVALPEDLPDVCGNGCFPPASADLWTLACADPLITVTFTECPPGFNLVGGKCVAQPACPPGYNLLMGVCVPNMSTKCKC